VLTVDVMNTGKRFVRLGWTTLAGRLGILAGLALLNARLYRPEEVKAMTKFQNDNYGSQFFPTLQTVQEQVFTKSLIGPQVKTYLGFLLIKPTVPGGKQLERAKADLP